MRVENEAQAAELESYKAKVKTLEQDILSKDQQITSLTHRNGVLEGNVESLDQKVKDHKQTADDLGVHGTQNEALQRKLQLLEEEAETADRHLREANEKYERGLHQVLNRQTDQCVLQIASNRRKGRPL